MTQPTIYIETSVISYLTARLSNDLVIAAHQKLTRDRWEQRRVDVELYTSQWVTQEARRGDSQAAANRWQILILLIRALLCNRFSFFPLSMAHLTRV